MCICEISIQYWILKTTKKQRKTFITYSMKKENRSMRRIKPFKYKPIHQSYICLSKNTKKQAHMKHIKTVMLMVDKHIDD